MPDLLQGVGQVECNETREDLETTDITWMITNVSWLSFSTTYVVMCTHLYYKLMGVG